MNTQEYRIKSAEALGIHITLIGGIYYLTNRSGTRKDGIWHPDQDANQMLMVWDWLRGEVQGKVFTKIVKAWFFQTDDILLATAKAFLEYITSK